MDAAPPEQKRAASNSPSAARRRSKLLFISADPVGAEMAGLGIRYWELARSLSAHAQVTIAHGGTQRSDDGTVRTVPFQPHRPAPLRALIDDADVVVTHPQWPIVTRWLRRSRARVIFDLYDPETLETLELLAGRSPLLRRQLTATTIDRLHDALRTGHNFICASEKQRDLWIGAMLALRLIHPDIYDRDPSFRSVIDLVPFGVPDEPPAPALGRGPRELIPALGSESEIVLWNGGIWRWLDAETAIRAVRALAERRPSVRLVFMGAGSRHPAAAQSADAARTLSRSLGVLDSTVHFHEGWVPYGERSAWLMQAACAISTHAEHLETRFAFRTRLLDCFWAGLPVVCSTGDDLAAQVGREALGATASPGDVDELASALERVLERGRKAYAPSLQAAADERRWKRVAQPLAAWISDPDLPERPGDGPGVIAAPPAQRLREVAYRAWGRAILSRR